MATIALYAGTINQMPWLITAAKSSVSSFKDELKDVYRKALDVDSSVCDMTDVIDSIRSSTQTQEDRIAKLEAFHDKSEEFIHETVAIDTKAAAAVNQNKDDFYKKYSYLKPDCEKSGWEKFCEGLAKVGEWCKEHWKLIVTAIIVVVSVVLICTGVGAIFTAAAWGAIIGAGIGGVSGGLESMAAGGSFWEGFENGAFSGAISGAIMGGAMAGLGTLGATLGKGVSCISPFGKVVKVTATVTKTLSTVMGGFDTLAMMDKLFGVFGGNLASFNAKLHESKLYNIFQISVSAIAAFTGGMTSTMSCFVAGTMVLTANGLVAIENIKVGDKVISTNPETGVTEEKTVLETFNRTVTELVNLTIDGETITTTHNHPFYVVGKGFVDAGKLCKNNVLINNKQDRLIINSVSFESTEKPTVVYNFKVEDYHVYHVGKIAVLVHNAECTVEFSNESGLDEKEYKQQLKDQQDGLGELTIDEYKRNRQAYNDRKAQTGSGRDPNSVKYQNDARNEAIATKTKEFRKQGYSKSEAESMAKNWAKGKAALHGPDQIAGGNANNISGLGNSKINSSIGSQWKSKISILDKYINEISIKLPGTTKLSELDIVFVLK